MTEAKNYKDTVSLPQTGFEMRANAAKREPAIQKFWAENQIYEQLSQENPGPIFILHDGPPYANGSLHIGHALNKTLKDIINRYQLLQGRKVRYIPGWDCHGMPIELKVLKQMKPEDRETLTPLKLRQKAKKFALKAVTEQSKDFQRYGVWGDWDYPYLTLQPEYEAAQIGVFGEMVLKGYIYRGLKPVHWSPSSKTALAEAELEYPDNHVSRSIYVAFPIVALAPTLPQDWQQYLPNLSAAIWTTTPWTIPGNLATSVNPGLTYAVVKMGEEEQYLIVAADLVDRLSEVLATKLTVQATAKGAALEHCVYRHPLFNRESEIVIGGDYVTTESGTGLVHTAPGHGLEDYAVGQRYGLPIFAPVDESGNFTEEAGQFAGLNVLGSGNAAVIGALEGVGALLKEEAYNHKYPYDWRTKEPTIFRATEQWFASVEGFREMALQAIEDVEWIPAKGQNRITAMVGDRSDWCISRQRSWGLPIPVFYEEETGEPLLDQETIAHVQAVFAEKGSDAWWHMAVEALLPEAYRNNGKKYRKGTDTMDVWFDSGSSWAAVVGVREGLSYPVDIYLEGSDQHRGWFQSSLLTSVATKGRSPYNTVLTHGFVLDEQGRKMSKSLGNVVDPKVVIEGGKNKKVEPAFGADVLRLWVSSVDYSSDVTLSKNIVKQMADIYRKIRNTARFLLGNLYDFDPQRDAVPYEELPDLDKYMLHRMTEVFAEVTDAFESYQFFRFFQTVQNFCVVDLSNFYLDSGKDRLYISAGNAYRRRSCQTVLAIAVENLARAIAPVLCHTAEDIWQNLPYSTPYKSVFQSGWLRIEAEWHNPELAQFWQALREIRDPVNQVLESARQNKMLGSSLEAKVLLYTADAELSEKLKALNPSDRAPGNGSYGNSTAENGQAQPEQTPEASAPTAAVAETAIPEASEKAKDSSFSLNSLGKLVFFLPSLPDRLGQSIGKYQRAIVTVALLLGTALAVDLTAAVLSAVNNIPALPTMFELIGMGYSFWFVCRYLLLAATRQELAQKIAVWQEEVTGKQEKASAEPASSSSLPEEEVVSPETSVPEEMPASSQDPEKPEPEKQKASLAGNGVDELRYLFICSQVELLDSPSALAELEYKMVSDKLGVGVVKADGVKCDRCWNYSTRVGENLEHPTICERCVAALAGDF